MARYWRNLVPGLCAVLVAGCVGGAQWMQIRADGPNAGYVDVHSSVAISPATIQRVGNVSPGSSPVIDSAGTAYVGTTHGEVVAAQPNAVLWVNTIPPAVVSSPALGSDGNVYVTFVREAAGQIFSGMYAFGIDSRFVQAFDFPNNTFTSAAPKLWTDALGGSPWVFVPVHSLQADELLVFRGTPGSPGQAPVHREPLLCPRVVTGGSGDWWKGLLGALTLGVSLAFTGSPFQFMVSGRPPDPVFGNGLYPSVAIVDNPRITTSGHPLIVVATDLCGVQAFQWSPNENRLSRLWTDTNTDLSYTSPAVSAGGRAIVGRDDGHVVAYDVTTGTHLWDQDLKEPVASTPSLFPGGTYKAFVVTNRKDYQGATIYALSLDDGSVANAASLPSTTVAAPAVSLDEVYVSTAFGLFTFRFDLTVDGVDRAFVGGTTSPTISPNGSVYAATVGGDLEFYRNR